MADKPEKKIDPYDVAAVEKSLNDSATRVSTIWVSFLIFSLYLLTAAATVTHRQLFLAEPVKLPVLNIELPLWGFFFLAPILFVILHAYVLIQVILLARTAAAYNEAIDKNITDADDNARVRQRLANTLFAQIFAGSPRERAGWLGWLLKAMAWITLASAPILILLVFQFMFLPYHSHLATWAHRLLVLAELAAMFWLWPLALDAKRDFEWSIIRRGLKAALGLPVRLLAGKDRRQLAYGRLRHNALPLMSCLLFVLVSLSVATFPGEPHINLLTGNSWSSVQCSRWFEPKSDRPNVPKTGDEAVDEIMQRAINAIYESLLPQFDRLNLPYVDVVDDKRLNELEKATIDRRQEPHEGERTKIFRDRDLTCADLSHADLRRVDLTGARLSHTRLEHAALEGAALNGAQLQGAVLNGAQLQGASLQDAQLQGASLAFAGLEGVPLDRAQLQGAVLNGARLQGASLQDAQLQGASLWSARLQATSLLRAQLQGAYGPANLQGAGLELAQLQGASLQNARLEGAFLARAQLQGADLSGRGIDYVDLTDAQVWRAKINLCKNTRASGLKPGAIIEIKRIPGRADEPIQATPDEITKFVERSVAEIPNGRAKERAIKQMRAALLVDPVKDDTAEIAKVWSDCEEVAKKKSPREFDGELALFLRDLVCNAPSNRRIIARGIVLTWIWPSRDRPLFGLLARALLGRDGKDCAATQDMDGPTLGELEGAVALSSTDIAPAWTPIAPAWTPAPSVRPAQ